jgi:hypothetical protein
MSHRRRWSEIALAIVLLAGSASAQPGGETTDAQKNAAQSLFDEGRRLMASDSLGEACAKFEESYRLYAASGTLLNMALCHERAGKTGSAYTEFNESLARAQRDHRSDREQTARAHLEALAPKLSRITVSVAEAAQVEGLEVTLDGVPWRRPSWAVPTIVDPGDHVATAKAPGRVDWSRTVSVKGGGDQQSVEVPPLHVALSSAPASPALASGPTTTPPAYASPAPLTSASPPQNAETQSVPDGQGRRTLGVVLAGAGVAGLATGSVFAVLAQSKWSAAQNDCPNHLCPDEKTRARDSGAGGLADVATVAFAVGGLAVAAGAVLYFVAPGARASIGLVAAPGFAGGSVGSRW